MRGRPDSSGLTVTDSHCDRTLFFSWFGENYLKKNNKAKAEIGYHANLMESYLELSIFFLSLFKGCHLSVISPVGNFNWWRK